MNSLVRVALAVLLSLAFASACGSAPPIPATPTPSTQQQRNELVRYVSDQLGYAGASYVNDAQLRYNEGVLLVPHVKAVLGDCTRHFVKDRYGDTKLILYPDAVMAANSGTRFDQSKLSDVTTASEDLGRNNRC